MTSLLMLLDAPSALTRTPEMTPGSTLFLVIAWTFVTGLSIWCFKRVLGGGAKA
ncbi:MAG: hypothetical protein H6825_04610 [Planctomycetes bacterium]|nr:hypothetical protein [Planctomycetota bacterium]